MGNSAWAVFDWDFTAKLANGQPFTSKGWESHVYEKTDRGWRISHLPREWFGQPPVEKDELPPHPLTLRERDARADRSIDELP